MVELYFFHFDRNTLGDYEKAVYDFIRLVALKNVPLSCVEDKKFRPFNKHTVNIGKRTISEVMFQLVELLEHKITEGVSGARGALMFDGWTHKSMRYIELYLVYCTPVTYCEASSTKSKLEPHDTLIAVPPMANKSGAADQDSGQKNQIDDEVDRGTANFDARTHIQFFTDIFKLYKLSFDQWMICFFL